MSHDLISVLYRSVAKLKEHTHAETELLLNARTKNQLLGITGFLHREEDLFFQVLEGPRETIDAVIERIALDTRHEKLEFLDRRSILTRAFEAWSMGYSNSGDGSLFDWSSQNGIPLNGRDHEGVLSFLQLRSMALNTGSSTAT
ncbi:BLUF domain-containing protein [Paracoccus laeviglucosivorans]|uniref:BLUF domain-containing protein n=1 Tax=Paracoccus laeviglucosivorans TaxID=1197861 RepID=UPI00115934E7|nr:BLUF domain-containing protein [Paracoccus laeviglucosivorans]